MKKKNPLTLYILADGARPDIFKRLLDEGQLPNIQREIVRNGTFRMASSCFPTTTGPAYLPMIYGNFPGTLNVPGIRWFDKVEFRRKRFGRLATRTYVGPEARFFNEDVKPGYPSLHELFDRPYNIFSMLTKGVPEQNDLGKKGKSWMYFRAHYFFVHQPVDDEAHKRMMAGLDLDPEFFFVVFPCIDWNAHHFKPHHPETIKSYQFLDFSVGQVVEKLKKLGRWEDTLFIITSDHGLTATHTHFDLADFLRGQGLRTIAHPNIFSPKPDAAVMISGNSFGSIHVLKNSNDVLKGDDVITSLGTEAFEALLARPEVDFLTWRGEQDAYWVASRKGRAKIVKNGGLTYQPVTGDPFGLGAIGQPLDNLQALRATFDTDYPDALVQIEQLFRSRRAGDLIVSATPGYDLRGFWEIPEHHGSHGSLHREHVLVPFLYNQQGWDDRPARTADLFNTILKWMGKETREASDGRALL
jgi:hypothetical protein